MGLGAAIIGGLGTLGGAALGYFGQKDTNEEIGDINDRQFAFDMQKWQRYLDIADKEFKERQSLAQRKYSAALNDYNIKSAAIDTLISKYKGYENDPTQVPAWQGFYDALIRETQKQTKATSNQLERAGRTGGAQDRARQDITQTLLESVGTKMLEIQKSAETKQLELEGNRPSTPFLEFYGYPDAGSNPAQYATSPQAVPTFNAPDLSGLGAAMYDIINEYQKTQNTTSPYVDNWVNFGGGSSELYPSQKLR